MQVHIGTVAALAVLSVVGGPTLGQAQNAVPALAGTLTVHEWGVFTVRPDAESANADLATEWAGLPKFVYGQIRGRGLPNRTIVTAVRKPVVYFHADRELTFELTVQFAKGLPAVWWPATASPGLINGGVGARLPFGEQPPNDNSVPATQATDTLVWDLKLVPGEQLDVHNARRHDIPAGHWFAKLRAVKANWIFALPSGQAENIRESRLSNREQERFVYYDGVMPVGKWAVIKLDGDKIGLSNSAAHELLDVTVVDRRSAGKVRVARLDKLAAGQAVASVELTEIDAKDWPKSAAARLSDQLSAAGLNRDEAESLTSVWEKEFFAGAGVSVWYRLPQAEYEKLLPMTIAPAGVEDTKRRVRVGLILHPELGLEIDPLLAAQVAGLLRQLDDEDFAVREAATLELAGIGKPVVPLLRTALARGLSAEARVRVTAVLEKWDVRAVFPPLPSNRSLVGEWP